MGSRLGVGKQTVHDNVGVPVSIDFCESKSGMVIDGQHLCGVIIFILDPAYRRNIEEEVLFRTDDLLGVARHRLDIRVLGVGTGSNR